MFRDDFVPAVERERLAQEFLSLKHKTKMMIEITRMFHERTLFCPEQVSMEQARVTWYLSILRRGTREFVENITYRTLVELQTNVRRREIELET